MSADKLASFMQTTGDQGGNLLITKAITGTFAEDHPICVASIKL